MSLWREFRVDRPEMVFGLLRDAFRLLQKSGFDEDIVERQQDFNHN